MEAKLDALFKSATAEGKMPAVAAVVLDVKGNVLYKNAFGTNNIDDPSAPAFTTSTAAIMWSTTKLVTSVAALQLIEQGKLSLDDPVEKYVPEIKNIRVLEGFDENGKSKLRAPKTKATILHLFTHTAGFSYDFFDADTAKWRVDAGQSLSGYLAVGAMSDYSSPFLHDPGTAYCYGVNTDWLGFVVEAVSGLRLDKYIDQFISAPLGLHNTSQQPDPTKDLLIVHMRGEGGKLVAVPALAVVANPERVGGGGYLYSTLDDYSNFLLTILNNGTHPQTGVKILEADTVTSHVFHDYMPQICDPKGIGEVGTANPVFSLTGNLLPDTKLGWSCGLMLNLTDLPNGRNAGSGAWAGLGNLYYWLDPTAGKLGLIMTSILPFMDPESLALFDALERAAYEKPQAKEVGEKGSNYSVP